MKTTLCLVVFSCALLAYTFLAAAQTCPECYHDRPRPTGNGASVTGDGRQRLQIYVDQTGMTGGQHSAAPTGVDGAASMWNDATADDQTTTYHITHRLESAADHVCG